MLRRFPKYARFNIRLYSGITGDARQDIERHLSSRDSRLLSQTLEARVYRPQIELNPDVAKAINNNITALHLPNNLRRVAKNQFLALRENKLHNIPQTALQVDAHIASFLLGDYASAYQVLKELQSRRKNFNPQRILEVGIGPAVGILALNDVMGPKFRPELKDSIIVSGSEMKKRAKIVLSRQENEIPNELLDPETVNVRNLEEDEKDDLVGEIMTNKIKINTNLRNGLPKNKEYDLIILSHQLLQNEGRLEREVDQNVRSYLRLLAPGGHIVFIERGTPLGFESIARARQYMIRPENFPDEVGKIPRPWNSGSISDDICKSDEDELPLGRNQDYYLKVIAPCSHHKKCPLQTGNTHFYEFTEGKKLKYCAYQKAVKRPKFSLELKKGKLLATSWETEEYEKKRKHDLKGSGRPFSKDYELINYAYLIVERSKCDAESVGQIKKARENNVSEVNNYGVGSLGDNTPNTWPRILGQPTKNKGHVVLDLCANSGQIEKWIIPKSFSKQIYHDARKSQKGDLWGLDAKTKIKSLGKINVEKFEKLERKRVLELKEKTKQKEIDIAEKLQKSEYLEGEASQEEAMNDIAEVYGHYFNKNKK